MNTLSQASNKMARKGPSANWLHGSGEAMERNLGDPDIGTVVRPSKHSAASLLKLFNKIDR
jgi:hypothetical protein